MKKYKALEKSLKTGSYTCRSLWIAGRRESTVFGVVDDTTTTKFVNRACAVHGISLPVVVDKVVVVVLKFPIVTFDIGLHEACVRVGGWAGVRYVITKFSQMDSLPNFITHGAPL